MAAEVADRPRLALAPGEGVPLKFFEDISGTLRAPWEIQRAQKSVTQLADAGAFDSRSVLDVGTGAGDNAFAIAKRPGARVTAFDAVSRAVDTARERAAAAGVDVTFAVADALTLDDPASPLYGQQFDAVVDSSIFHIFSDAQRVRYAASLASVTKPGGTLYMLVFSDKDDLKLMGPRRLSKAEIEGVFNQDGTWQVVSIEEAEEETFNLPDLTTVISRAAYLSIIRRL